MYSIIGLYCYFFEWWIANCHTNSTSRIFQSSLFSISQFPIRDSWISHLETQTSRSLQITRTVFRGSGLDCQLTFEHFCAEILELYLIRVRSLEGWFSLSFPFFPYYFSIHQHFSLFFYFILFFLRERHTKCSHVLEISSKLGNCCNVVRYW